ncbi:MAG: dicarboxylate/amino acid:cation symporter [Peptococcaceae bacterium]|nr:dicarboxylate/amino acid:cation symporter [Peptococcaceae bacterium]MBO5301626.1 dicarboxylate/amino acid:cation symporter [Peptococcaceae bacterium]MBO5365456.1 dicarboxylate/amino acid:cation symporter [Peptococcaceae bacterium]MBP3585753.1 dicarboxylate/amino acid:cation symporter [Peptococcaceae bacterium]MBQ2905650.1 dicarboxylate/amino acid:cation symporter [Peptococcaceae bacterium]
MTAEKKKLGLISKLLIGIVAGALIGLFLPEVLVRILVTVSSIFSLFLKFVIPFIIVSFVICGIADLAQGAGKLLGITTAIAYGSTILAGSIAYIVATNLFPRILGSNLASEVGDPSAGMLSSYFTIPLAPMLDVTAAIVFAFVMGIGISYLRSQGKGETLYNFFTEFQAIILKVLNTIIIPFLPVYVAGTFANIAYAGQIVTIMGLLGKVFATSIPLQLCYLFVLFLIASIFGKKNLFTLIKNQIPAYLTAVGTQSSAATIPVNVACAEKNGVSKQIREFVVPLCATIHLAGSITALTCFTIALLYINGLDYSIGVYFPFLLTLGIAMVAAPGAPGGAVMSALPFLPMIGIAVDSPIATLLIAMYLTQDSFGTAGNVSGDNAIAVIIDEINNRMHKKA